MLRDAIIVGAGIVGLTTAYQLIRLNPHLKIQVLEKEGQCAMHQTGRNSGVVHSGIYYKPGSLKAKNCIAGRKELLEFCDAYAIPYQNLSKVIVATDPKELPKLYELFERGKANGIHSISLVGKERLNEIEPNVTAIQAIHIPNCQIIDFKGVANELCKWIVNQGGEVTFNSEVIDIRMEPSKCIVASKGNTYESKILINCAGLHSDRIAKISLGPQKIDQRILPFRGEYYNLKPSKRDVVKGLVYPVPDPTFPFLGVHLTKMLDGNIEAGPNAVLSLSREGYKKSNFSWRDTKDILSYPGFWKMASKYWKDGCYEIARSLSKRLFLKDLQRLVPMIQMEDLIPGNTGVRAQVVTRQGGMLDDFSIVHENNTIHVLNAPSPAATSSFSIGAEIAKLVMKAWN